MCVCAFFGSVEILDGHLTRFLVEFFDEITWR